MSAKQQIERHIVAQVETMQDWQSARPKIRQEISDQRQRLANLEALAKAQSSQIAALQSRLRALESRPTGIRALLK